MAHPWLWLTACGIVVLCVAVPHAFCHPTPDDSKKQLMPYYQQAQEPEHYYPAYDEEEEETEKEKINLQDFEPVLADKIVLITQQIILSSLEIFGVFYVAYTFFVPYFYQGTPPEKIKATHVPVNARSGSTGTSFDSVDFAQVYNKLEMPTEELCRQKMICEMRCLMTYHTPLENIIRTYGMRVPGLSQGYQKALDAGSSRRSCKTPQNEECYNSVLTILLSMAKTITGEHH